MLCVALQPHGLRHRPESGGTWRVTNCVVLRGAEGVVAAPGTELPNLPVFQSSKSRSFGRAGSVLPVRW